MNLKTLNKMAKKKKLYRQVIQVEVLSEEPIPDGLSHIIYMITDGHCSGKLVTKKDEIVTGRKAAKMVMEHGTDLEFFQMNEFGNVVDDEFYGEDE